MLTERAYLLVKEGFEPAFATMMAEKGLALLNGVGGVRQVRFGPGVENPGKFMLLVEWTNMDAHTAFTKAPVFADFRALLTPFTKGGEMEHFDLG